jgi:DnaK suppressor protein
VSNEERAEIKSIIIETIAAVKEEMALLAEKGKPIAPDCALGRLTRIEAMQEQELSMHRLHETGIRLNKLEYALRKIGTPEYGLCIECEEPIAVARLKLMPEATLCIRCAK